MLDVMVATPFFSILHWVFARCARYAGCARCDGCAGCAGYYYSSRYAGCAVRSLIRHLREESFGDGLSIKII